MIHNGTYQAELNCEIPLDDIGNVLVNCEYQANKYICVEIRKPSCRVQIYSKGTLILAGPCGVDEAKNILKAVARRIRDKVNLPVKFDQFQVNSLMGVSYAGGPLNLPALGTNSVVKRDTEPYKWLTSYDPQQYAGAKMTIPVPLSALSTPEAIVQAKQFLLKHHRKVAGRNSVSKASVNVVWKGKELSGDSTLDVFVNAFTTGKLGVAGPCHSELLMRALQMLLPKLQPFVR